jgi:hypothetical protein
MQGTHLLMAKMLYGHGEGHFSRFKPPRSAGADRGWLKSASFRSLQGNV